MSDQLKLQEAIETAWAVFIATRNDVDDADERQCSLARHLSERILAGETDTQDLACAGLEYLDRVPIDTW